MRSLLKSWEVRGIGPYRIVDKKIVRLKPTLKNKLTLSWFNPLNWIKWPVERFSLWFYWKVTDKWEYPWLDKEGI